MKIKPLRPDKTHAQVRSTEKRYVSSSSARDERVSHLPPNNRKVVRKTVEFWDLSRAYQEVKKPVYRIAKKGNKKEYKPRDVWDTRIPMP